jgi:hypothetical protein
MLKSFIRPLIASLRRESRDRIDQQISGPATVKRRKSTIRDEAESTDGEATTCESSLYQDGLRRAALDLRCTNLTLWEFVDQSDHQDFLALKHAWQLQLQRRKKKHQWKDIKFVDTLRGSDYRRWQYKKDGLLRRLQKSVLLVDGISIQFETRLQLSDMSPQAIVSVLQLVPSDLDITELHVSGEVPYAGIAQVMDALIALIEQKDRSWKGVFVSLSPLVGHSPLLEEEHLEGQRMLKKRCRELHEVASSHGIPYVILPDAQ